MSLETLKERLPAYARDLKLNLSSLAAETVLAPETRAGAFIASAIAARQPDLIRHVLAEFAPALPPDALAAAKAAAAIMSMNNVYYRFVHFMGESDYKRMPARLRMNVMANPGAPKADFELWSVAVSAVNGCGMCLESHEHELRKLGVSAEQVQAAVRIAAVIHAVAVTLSGEHAMAGLGEATTAQAA